MTKEISLVESPRSGIYIAGESCERSIIDFCSILRPATGLCKDFGFTVVDGTLPIHVQQQEVRRIAQDVLEGWQGLPALHTQKGVLIRNE